MIDRDIQGMPSQGMPPMQLRAVGLRGGRQAALASTSAPFTRFFLVQEIHRGAEDGPKFERARCGGDDRRAPKPPHTSDGAHAPPQTSPRPTAARWQNSQPPHHSLSTPLTPLRSRHTRVSTVVVRCQLSQLLLRSHTRTGTAGAAHSAPLSSHPSGGHALCERACCLLWNNRVDRIHDVPCDTLFAILYTACTVHTGRGWAATGMIRLQGWRETPRNTQSSVDTHTTAGPWPRVLLPPPLAVRSRIRALISSAHSTHQTRSSHMDMLT